MALYYKALNLLHHVLILTMTCSIRSVAMEKLVRFQLCSNHSLNVWAYSSLARTPWSVANWYNRT